MYIGDPAFIPVGDSYVARYGSLPPWSNNAANQPLEMEYYLFVNENEQ